MKYKVKTPNKSFKGKRFGVFFRDGEAVAELDTKTVQDLKGLGYQVDAIEEKKTQKKTQPKK